MNPETMIFGNSTIDVMSDILSRSGGEDGSNAVITTVEDTNETRLEFNVGADWTFLTFDPSTIKLIDATAMTDEITVFWTQQRDTIFFGTQFNDAFYYSREDAPDFRPGNLLLEGRAGDDLIVAGNGENTPRGGDGSDTIEGGNGIDRIGGGAEVDFVAGGGGNDFLWGDGGDDFLSGDDGDDHVWGGSGNDAIIGAEGNDSLGGNSGNDYLAGGLGAASLHGGTGNDRIYAGEGDDIIKGGPGDDTVLYDGNADEYLFITISNDEATTRDLKTGEIDRLFSIDHVIYANSAALV